jgi:glucokinase
MLAQVLAANGDIQAKDVLDAAKAGDQAASAIVDQAVTYLGLALSHLGMVLNPSRIVIGGGVALAGDFLFSRLRQAFARYIPFSYVRESTQIIPASLGNDAGVYGAAWLIRSRMNPAYE